MTDVIRPAIIPIFWLTTGVTPVEFAIVRVPATVRLLVDDVLVDDFEWGWPQQTLTIKLDVVPNSWPPPQPDFVSPNGAPWAASPRLNAGYLISSRLRSDTGAEVGASGGAGSAALGEINNTYTTGASRAGPTGFFRLKFPGSYDPDTALWIHDDVDYWLNVYPDDLDFPGVNVETPLQFSGRPSVGISGQLLTAIDGGSP
jgi:hypothetical protein